MKKVDKIVIVLSIIFAILLIIFLTFNSKVNVTLISDGKVYKVIKTEKHKAVALPEPEKEGYDFDGWYDGDIYYSHGAIFNKSVKLEAKWLDQNRQEVELSFASDSSGNIIKTVNIKCGGVIGDTLFNSITPIKTGYVFQYKKKKKGNRVKNDSKIECRDMTYTATWKKIEYESVNE